MKLNYFLIFIGSLFLSCKNGSSSKVNTNRSKKVGQIFFSKTDLTNTEDSDIDYINNFNLNKDGFLSIHFTLQKPLVKSLKELAPNLSNDELLSKGNFQFSFLIDDKLLYQENLNTGALLTILETKQLKLIFLLRFSS